MSATVDKILTRRITFRNRQWNHAKSIQNLECPGCEMVLSNPFTGSCRVIGHIVSFIFKSARSLIEMWTNILASRKVFLRFLLLWGSSHFKTGNPYAWPRWAPPVPLDETWASYNFCLYRYMYIYIYIYIHKTNSWTSALLSLRTQWPGRRKQMGSNATPSLHQLEFND